jgi:MFS family permease
MAPSFETLNSLKSPGFRFYLGSYLSNMATHDMRTVAQSLLIYRLTGSVAILGILSLVNAIPGTLLPLAGGVVADRLPKKLVINIGQAGTLLPSLVVAGCLSLGFLSAEHAGSWWILMVTSFFNTSITSLTTPARQAIISELVGKEHIMNAISLRSTGYNILHLGAPALAGVIIDKFDFASVYYIMGALSFIGLVFTLFLPNFKVQIRKSQSALSQLKDGFKYARRETHILFILIFTMVVAILMTPYSRLLPVYVDDILKVGATGYGLLLSASAIGGIIGALVMASLPSKKRGIMLLIDVTVLGLGLMLFAFSRNWPFSLAVIVLIGLAQPARLSISNSLVQSYTDHDYQGRMMSLYSLQDGILSLGGFIAAMVAGLIGTPWTVFSFALAMVLLSLLSFIFLPRIRKLD